MNSAPGLKSCTSQSPGRNFRDEPRKPCKQELVMITITANPFTVPVLVCGTIIQFRMLNNRCQTEERKEAFAFLLLWTLFFQSSHFFSCHDSVNRSLSFSHACCILMRDQFMSVICRAGKGPAPAPCSIQHLQPQILRALFAGHL